MTRRVPVPLCFKKNITNDKVTSKKAFADLGTLGCADPGWDRCSLYLGTEKGDTGIAAAASFKDICYSNFIERHIKY